MRRMLDDGYTHFVELAPHPVLAASIFETAGAQRVSVTGDAAPRSRRPPHPAELRRRVALPTVMTSTGTMVNPGDRAPAQVAVLPVADEALLERDTGSQPKRCSTTRCIRFSASRSAACIPRGKPSSARPATPIPRRPPGAGQRRAARSRVHRNGPGGSEATYGSSHSVDNLVLHRAVILDDTCDPMLRTTLHQDDGTLEFAAFTATSDGDLEVDDHRDRGAQHPAAPPLPATTTGCRGADHLDRRRGVLRPHRGDRLRLRRRLPDPCDG